MSATLLGVPLWIVGIACLIPAVIFFVVVAQDIALTGPAADLGFLGVMHRAPRHGSS